MKLSVTQFKTKCLRLIGQVATTRKSLVITKRGKALAKLVLIDYKALPPLFGCMKGTGQILCDIVNVPHDVWAVETGEEDEFYTAVQQKKKAPKKKAVKKRPGA